LERCKLIKELGRRTLAVLNSELIESGEAVAKADEEKV
jgi:hypothetical protein